MLQMVKIQADIRGIAYVEVFWKILNFSLKLYHIYHFEVSSGILKNILSATLETNIFLIWHTKEFHFSKEFQVQECIFNKYLIQVSRAHILWKTVLNL